MKSCKNSKTFLHLDKNPNWTKWTYELDIKLGGTIRVNVLHVAIIIRNFDVIKHILDRDDTKEHVIQETVKEVKACTENLEFNDWIFEATAVHLAARFCHQALPLLLNKNRELIDNQSNKNEFSPLHVTSIAELHMGTR